jgi:hypothetical protein
MRISVLYPLGFRMRSLEKYSLPVNPKPMVLADNLPLKLKPLTVISNSVYIGISWQKA